MESTPTKGTPTGSSWTAAHRDVVWQRLDGIDYLARVYQPSGSGAPTRLRPALVEVHGGAWCDNDRKAGTLYNKALAASGLVVVAVDFRMGPDHHHPAASDDVAAAIRWVRASATELGVDPRRVAVAGSSSGGHLALLAALRMEDPPAGVIALWPPTDPLARFRYASAKHDAHGQRLVSNTLAYFVDEANMDDASVARTVRSGDARSLPRVLLVHPEEDMNVPRAISEELIEQYRAAGGQLDVWWVPGQPHAFGHTESDATTELIARMRAMLEDWMAP